MRSELLTPAEVMEELSISRWTLWRLVKRGLLVPQRIGRQRRFSKQSVRELLKIDVLDLTIPDDAATQRWVASGGGVYLIACGPFVKIGIAANLKERLTAFTIHNPYEIAVLGRIPTKSFGEARKLELALHDRFRAARHHGEWFAMSNEIEAFLASIAGERN